MQGYEFSAKKTYLLFWCGVFFWGGKGGFGVGLGGACLVFGVFLLVFFF